MTKRLLYYYAHEALLLRWSAELNFIERNPELELPIAHYKAEMYRKELDELEIEMLKMEQERA